MEQVPEKERVHRCNGSILVHPERPSGIEDFWMANYPEIDTIPRKITQMEKAGYIPTAHFILPENCWTEHFYAPQFPVEEAF